MAKTLEEIEEALAVHDPGKASPTTTSAFIIEQLLELIARLREEFDGLRGGR